MFFVDFINSFILLDGENKLVIAGQDKRLLVYRGTTLAHEITLLETPSAMCVTYTDNAQPRLPAVAVAAGPYVFIYRQLRPYRKWICPPIEINRVEKDIWEDVNSGRLDSTKAVELLIGSRDNGVQLSPRSLDLIALAEEHDRRDALIRDFKDVPITSQPSIITCMELMKKDSEVVDAMSLLIVGTESGSLYFLPPDP